VAGRAQGQVTRMTFERSCFQLLALERAGVLTMKPTVSPDFGRHFSSGDFFTCGPMLSRSIPLQTCPGRRCSPLRPPRFGIAWGCLSPRRYNISQPPSLWPDQPARTPFRLAKRRPSGFSRRRKGQPSTTPTSATCSTGC